MNRDQFRWLLGLAQVRRSMYYPTDEWSAVSKLSFFANPRCSILIWDKNVRLAIEHRYPVGENPRPNGYTVQDLPQFWQNASQCLATELGRRDFEQAVNAVIPRLNYVREAVFDGDDVPLRDFAARRLLDKLMYYEGRLLKAHGGDPCGDAALRLVSKWIEALETDIAAADEANRHLDAAD